MPNPTDPRQHASERTDPYPDALDLHQIFALTDDTGILQHARLGQPDPNHGYCVDDNARALIAACRLLEEDHPDGSVGIETLVNRYLTFVAHAVDPESHRIRNFMSYGRQWLEAVGSHDAQGRTMWGLAVAACEAPLRHQRELAGMVFSQALPCTEQLDSLRTWAFLIIALDRWCGGPAGSDDTDAKQRLVQHAQQLGQRYRAFATDDWPWWEPAVTYDNARLPQAMLRAGARLGHAEYTAIGLRSLDWLLKTQTHPKTGHLRIIGNDGWYTRHAPPQAGPPAPFDQQPLEVPALIDACAAAYDVTGEDPWLGHAKRCFAWFYGDNCHQLSLIHPETGGCQDGLTTHGVNRNQGAESVLSYILSCQAIRGLFA